MGKHKYSAILKIVILLASVALASSTRNDSLTAFRKIHCDSGSANIDTLLSDTIYNVGGIKTASGFWGTVGQPGGAQFTLPASDGTSGQVLTTNGSRGLYFTNGGGGGTGTITSINGSSTAIQTIIPGTGLFVKDSGTGNSVHNIAAASGYLIPTGSNKRVDSTTLADSSKVSVYATRSDSSRADHMSDSANGSKYLGGHASSFFQTYYSILTAIGSLSTGTNGALYNTSGTVSWQDSVFHAYWARLSDSAKAAYRALESDSLSHEPGPWYASVNYTDSLIAASIAGLNQVYYYSGISSDVSGSQKMLKDSLAGLTTFTTPSLSVGTDSIKTWITEPGQPDMNHLVAGVYNFHIHASASVSGAKSVTGLIFVARYTDASGARLGVIDTSYSTGTIGSSAGEYNCFFDLANVINIATVDRISVTAYAIVTGPGGSATVTLYYGDNSHDSHILFPTNVTEIGNLFLGIHAKADSSKIADSSKAYDNRYLGRHQVSDSSHFADSAWRADSTRLADSAAVSHYATRADSSRAAHVSDTALDAGKFAGKSWPLDSCNDAKLFAGHAWPVDSVRADHKADTAINSSHARSSDTVVSLIEWNKIHNAPSFMLTFPNPDSGNGTANYVARFLSQNKVGTGVIYDNGTNVGIGTTSPTVKLVVQSAAANSNVMYINASGGTNNLFAFVDNNSTGDAQLVMNKNTESGSISTGIVLNTNGWSYLNGGNVGIGTTSPGGQLDIGGSNVARNLLGFTYTAYGDIAQFSYSVTAPYPFVLTTGSSRPFAIMGGNVGIGTTSPGSLLQVNGGAAIGYSSSTAAPTNGLTISGLACIGTTSPTAYTALSILENNTSINGAFSVTNNSSSNTLTASSAAITFASGTGGSVYSSSHTSSSLGQSYGSSIINQINSNGNSFLAVGYKLGVNIGIPSYTLDVGGDINSNGSIRINDGHIALQIGRLANSDVCKFINTAGDFELEPVTQVTIGGGGNLLVDGDATISGDAILQGDIYTTQMTNTGLSIVGWSTQTGKGVYYVQVGKRVDVFFDLIGMGSGTNAYVTGLPVASTVISNQNFIEAYDNSTQSVGLCGTSGGQLNFSPSQEITSNLWANGTLRNAIGMLTYYTN